MNSEFQPQPFDDDASLPTEESQPVPQQEAADEDTARLIRLKASPEDEAIPVRMRQVDHLLSTTPMAVPRPGFADRVLALLKEHTPYILKPHAGLGLALGLSLSAGFAIFMVIVVLILIALIALNWSKVYRTLALAVGEISTFIGGILDSIGQLVNDAPLPALIITGLAIVLFAVWLWVSRRRSRVTESEG